jgi:type I restriction enzyme M protein
VAVNLTNTQLIRSRNIHSQAPQLEKASGYKFYNTSRFTLRRLLDEPSQIRANFENYLNGFSENVKQIVAKFKFHNQLDTLVESNRLYGLIEKFLSNDINLSPEPVKNEKGEIVHEGLTNHGMGYVFEELIRKFNEENNEEAGEHFTPRDIIELMVNLLFLPVKKQIKGGTYLVYDCACGSGGMLTEAETFIQRLAKEMKKTISIQLYGQEINPETYAICQADMLIQGKDPSDIKYGSTFSQDGFGRFEFDFMLANPPHGKSWKLDREALEEKVGGKKEVTDPRFVVKHSGLLEGERLELLPSVSDGQLLFQVNMLAKMKRETKLGSRIAIVHNGSALFSGKAGSGESNIRRWVLENDWLEAIVALPLDMFYNTNIATYVWVLSNRKRGTPREGKVQLINATEWFRKLRKNQGKKNCRLTAGDIQRITDLYVDFVETEQSKILDYQEFGYHRIVVERPLRLRFQVTPERLARFRKEVAKKALADLLGALGNQASGNFNAVRDRLEAAAKAEDLKLTQKDWRLVRDIFTEKDETAEPVILEQTEKGVVYEPDSELRDTEEVPMKEEIGAYFEREVLPYVPDAWVDHERTVRGYEILFTKYFYKFKPLRSLEEIKEDILKLEAVTEGVLRQIVKDV